MRVQYIYILFQKTHVKLNKQKTIGKTFIQIVTKSKSK